MKQRESGTVTNPSTLVRDLDPLVERVILRCLETDPEKTSGHGVCKLPPRSPAAIRLAAALAAGETPSPQNGRCRGRKKTGARPRAVRARLPHRCNPGICFLRRRGPQGKWPRPFCTLKIRPRFSPRNPAKSFRAWAIPAPPRPTKPTASITTAIFFLTSKKNHSQRPQWGPRVFRAALLSSAIGFGKVPPK